MEMNCFCFSKFVLVSECVQENKNVRLLNYPLLGTSGQGPL